MQEVRARGGARGHTAATKRMHATAPSAMPKPKARKLAGRKGTVIGMPVIMCRFCRPAVQERHARRGKICAAQASRLLGPGCGMRPAPDGGSRLRAGPSYSSAPAVRHAPCTRRRVPGRHAGKGTTR